MQLKRLGNSDMELTPIGIGAWAMGGSGWAFAWGPQDDDDSIAAIHAALDRGINWIDTAAVYGLGHSEEVVARALAGRSRQPYVFTKCARIWDESRQIRKPQGRFHSPRMRSQPAPVAAGRDRPLPDPLARARSGYRGRLEHLGEAARRGQSPLDRRLEFQCRPDARAQAIAPITSLQSPYSIISPEIEQAELPYVQQQWHRRAGLFADEVGSAHWRDVEGARGGDARRRFPPPHAALSGAEPDTGYSVGMGVGGLYMSTLRASTSPSWAPCSSA